MLDYIKSKIIATIYFWLQSFFYFSYPLGSEKRLQIYQMATGRLGSACYIEGALSSMMFLALEFADHPSEGLLANANCGGK